MSKPKGGRGKSAPYTTRQVRVPEPIISQVDELIELYQQHLANGGDVCNPPNLLNNKIVDTLINNQNEAFIILEKVLKSGSNVDIKIREKLKQTILNNC